MEIMEIIKKRISTEAKDLRELKDDEKANYMAVGLTMALDIIEDAMEKVNEQGKV